MGEEDRIKHVTRVCSILIVSCLGILFCSIAYAASSQRVALVIGNGQYSSSPLSNPVNDATDMAAALKRLGFSVILKTNAGLRDMEEAIKDFGTRLRRGDVGLFYFAGHGVQISGTNYLIPIGARINKDTDVKYETVDAGRILDEMANAGNDLNIVILDACRDNPFALSFRSASRGLAMVGVPTGTFISYSTGAGQVAQDGEGRNSPYTAALLENIGQEGLPIEQVFKRVRQKLDRETGGKQIPWELSSLRGDFYFNPQVGSSATPTSPYPYARVHGSDYKDKFAIAIASFMGTNVELAEKGADLLFSELGKSDLLSLIKAESVKSETLFSAPFSEQAKVLLDLGAKGVIAGEVSFENRTLRFEMRYYDLNKKELLFGKRYIGEYGDLQRMVQRFAGEFISALRSSRGDSYSNPQVASAAPVKENERKPVGQENKQVTSINSKVGTPEESYKRAYDFFAKGNFEGAKEEFKRFLAYYPKSNLIESAHYWLGECYFSEKKFEEAILEFEEVIKNYPKGSKVPDALFRQGMAFLQMDDKVSGKVILKEVVRRFPKSEQAARARNRLKSLD